MPVEYKLVTLQRLSLTVTHVDTVKCTVQYSILSVLTGILYVIQFSRFELFLAGKLFFLAHSCDENPY